MKHSERPLGVLTASLLFCGFFGTGTLTAASWRDYVVERKPAIYFVGNQDFNTNDCIAWSSRSALLGEPVHALGYKVPSAEIIYDRAKEQKTRPGEKMDARHGAEALLEMGLIDGYETLQNPYEIWDWLKYRGPVAAAVYWDERMTNHRGSLREVPVDKDTWTTQKAHAITILGWDAKRRAFYFTPNLGTRWGSRGFAYLRETDFPHVFVNAVGFEHGNELDADEIGPKPPGSREKMRAAAAANVWYTAPGPMKTAKLGEAKVNVGTNVGAKADAKVSANPSTKVSAKPVAKVGSKTWARKAWLDSVSKPRGLPQLSVKKEGGTSLFAPRAKRVTVGRKTGR